MRGAEAYALQAATGERIQPLQGERQVRATLGGHQRVDLVDNDGFHGAQCFRGLRGEQQVERLGGGNQDLGWMAAEACALALRRVASADENLRLMDADAHAARHVGDAREWRAQVALHVNGQRLERRDVDHTAAAGRAGLIVSKERCVPFVSCSLGSLSPASEHQPVKAPEECGEGFAGAGGGQDQRALSARDGWPALPLRRGGRLKDGAEPCGGDGMKRGKGVGLGGRKLWSFLGGLSGHVAFEDNAPGSEEEAKDYVSRLESGSQPHRLPRSESPDLGHPRLLPVLLLLGRSLTLLRRRRLVLLLGCSLTLLLRCGLALLLRRRSLALLRRRRSLTLLLQRCSLALLLRRRSLTLLLRRCSLTLLLRRRSLTLLLRRRSLALLLLRCRLALLLLLYSRGTDRRSRRDPDVAISRKGPTGGDAGWLAMVHVGKLSTIGAGRTLILQLGTHGSRMLFMQRRQFRWPGAHLDAARSAVEADAILAPAGNVVVVDVPLHREIEVVDGSVVVEVAATPIAALIAEADVSKSVVNAAIEAHMPTPIATMKAVAIILVAPVAGGPQSPLVRSLNPCARHPVIARWGPRPVAGGPNVAVAGILGLLVLGQRRRRLVGVVRLLHSIARILHILMIWLVAIACGVILRRS